MANNDSNGASRPAGHRTLDLPFLWPAAWAIEIGAIEAEAARKGFEFLAGAQRLDAPPPPQFATPNRVGLDLTTLRLRRYSKGATRPAVLVVAPYAGHSSVIADLQKGQSLIETLLGNGLGDVALTDWKSAAPEMKDLTIDAYLAELNVCVDEFGGRVDLVGLCQGGWMSAAYAARFPARVRSLVLAGAPLDTQAGDGVLKHIVETMPADYFAAIVAAGQGLMRGAVMLAGWKNMHPDQQYLGKYVDLYEHIDDPGYAARTAVFASWYENPIDLPGRWYLQAIDWVFRRNLLSRGGFPALGRAVSLRDVVCPCYLLAGADDDITPKAQVFAAARHLGTRKDRIAQDLAPGGHIGLFMGHRPLTEHWPAIARWILERQSE